MVTKELATWVAQLRYEDLPEAVVEEAGRAFADFLGECLFVGATKAVGSEHRRVLRAGGWRAAGGDDHRDRGAHARVARGARQRHDGARASSTPTSAPAAVPIRSRSPVRWRSRRPTHRSGKELALAIVIGYEVMGRVFHATFERGKHIPFYVPSVYGTLAGGGRLRPAARPVAGAHQLRARAWRRRSPAAPSKVTRRVRGSDR